MLRLQALIERLRQSLWFWPMITGFASVGVALLLANTASPDSGLLDALLVSPSPASVRPLLATLLGAMLTAASVVSSLSIVALQLASTQFSPRLLRNFLRDGTTQAVLAFFVGTSGLLVTLIVEADDDSARIAVTVALIAVFVGVIVIAYFFSHVSQSIRVESIMASITEETVDAVERLEDWLATGRVSRADERHLVAHTTAVTSTHSGYVQQVDAEGLLHTASQTGATIRLVPQLGQPVIVGAVIAWWWMTGIEPPHRELPGESDDAAGPDVAGHDRRDDVMPYPQQEMADRIRNDIGIGYERTLHHDVALGMRQLVDMSIKAMSPAVNDPYTSMQALDHLGVILVHLGRIPLGDHEWIHEGSIGSVIVPLPTFVELASLACDQLRRYGAREPTVLIRMMTMLRDVASTVDIEHHDDLRRLASECGDGALDVIVGDRDRQQVAAVRAEVMEWFDHGVEPRSSRRNGL